MASTGQASLASLQRASSSGEEGCLYTKEYPPSSLRLKLSGAVSRHKSQSMHWLSTKYFPAMFSGYLFVTSAIKLIPVLLRNMAIGLRIGKRNKSFQRVRRPYA